VDVTRSGSYYSGYTWSITFLAPSGYVEPIVPDPTTLYNVGAKASVVKAENGSNTALLFQYIPIWMTEVPLEWAIPPAASDPNPQPQSNLEVYVATRTGDVLKAVCDGAPSSDEPIKAMLKGSERDCAYHFAASATAIVSGYSEEFTDDTASVVALTIQGSFFLKYRLNYTVAPPSISGKAYAAATVTIAGQRCNVTEHTDSKIRCVVTSVPWGSHVPEVRLEGYGLALHANDTSLTFEQDIFSVNPSLGSMAGGQIITVLGRGFRKNSQVTFQGIEGECYVLEHTPEMLRCRTPPAVLQSSNSSSNSTHRRLDFQAQQHTSFQLFHSKPQHQQHKGKDKDKNLVDLKQYMQYGQDNNSFTAPYLELSTEVLVDGSASGTVSGGIQYQYSNSHTPIVTSITPANLSSAITVNLTITGTNLMIIGSDESTSVFVGDQECLHVRLIAGDLFGQQSGPQTISCVLARSRGFGRRRAVPVKVYVSSLGYAAASNNSLSSFPMVERGFELTEFLPRTGSTLGGNILTILGTGFMAGRPELHKVELRIVGLPTTDSYDELLVALGFPTSTPLLAHQSIACAVTDVTDTQLVCSIPAHDIAYEAAQYTLLVTLNGIAIECGIEDTEDDGGGCSYFQLEEATPTFKPESLERLAKSWDIGDYTYAILLRTSDMLPYFAALVAPEKAGDGSLQIFVEGESAPCTVLELSGVSIPASAPAPVPVANYANYATVYNGTNYTSAYDCFNYTNHIVFDCGNFTNFTHLDDGGNYTNFTHLNDGGNYTNFTHLEDGGNYTNFTYIYYCGNHTDYTHLAYCANHTRRVDDDIQANNLTYEEGIRYTRIVFRTPRLSRGRWKLFANILGFGAVDVGLQYVDAESSFGGMRFAAGRGSLLGGTIGVIRGYGFQRNCADDEFFLLLNTERFGSRMEVPITEYISCTKNEKVFLTPSMESLMPGAGVPFSSYNTLKFYFLGYSVTMYNANGNSYEFGIIYSFGGPTSPFTWSGSATPTVSIAGSAGVAGASMVFNISLPPEGGPAGSSNTTISFGDECLRLDCSPVPGSLSQSQAPAVVLSCPIPALTARRIPYDIRVSVPPLGFAIDNQAALVGLPKYTSLFQPTVMGAKFQTINISSAGGSDLTITGTGFSKNISVKVCEKECIFDSNDATYNTVKCVVPARRTIKSVQAIQELGLKHNFSKDMISTLTGTAFSSNNQPAAAFDGLFSTYYQHTSTGCYLGIHLPTGYMAQPYRLRFYPQYMYSSYVRDYVYEGSTDGGSTWVTIATSNGAHEGWNYLDAASSSSAQAQTWFTSFRYRAADNAAFFSRCRLAEVEFLGLEAATEDTCPVFVSPDDPDVLGSTTVTHLRYSDFLNIPVVTSISPTNGSALGGTLVTIGGIFNQLDASYPNMPMLGPSEVIVEFSGVRCAVVSASINEIQCITSPRTPEDVQTSSIRVLLPNIGLAVVDDALSFLYIDRWSALTTWKNQDMPVDGDFVWIPDGQVVLLDVETPVLAFLLVEGDLFFDRERDVSVDSYYIFVFGGYMQVGTKDEPFEKKAVITLHGDRYTTPEIPQLGSKVLAVAAKGLTSAEFESGEHLPGRLQGQLEIHGQKRLRTWTKLEATANAGDDFILTSEPVDFKAGEIVVLTGSERPGSYGSGDMSVDAQEYYDDFAYYGMEELTVLDVIDALRVVFTTPLRFTHVSKIVTIEGRVVDMRVEVALLSRNVIIQGDEHSTGQLFGVHTVSFMSGIYRMENAEVRRCGQAFNVGRYCTHSHMAGNMHSSYVKANSIHHSFQRAVATHDTHNWEVRDNVAYDITGHAYIVEDGTEYNNYITGNLAIFIRRSSALLQSDMNPAGFWSRTPSNFWRDNVACHSSNFGFWFEFTEETEYGNCPQGQDVGEVVNITVHSNNNIGFRIYPGWLPHVDPCDSSSAPSPQYLYNLVSFHNNANGLFSKHHGDLHHVNMTLIENGGDAISIVKLEDVNYDNNPHIVNAILVGSLDPDFNLSSNVGTHAINSPQNEYFYVTGTTVVNWGSGGALTGCNECLVGSQMKQGAFTTR
jgi:hypothetical protein